jgi:hypothetical protein
MAKKKPDEAAVDDTLAVDDPLPPPPPSVVAVFEDGAFKGAVTALPAGAVRLRNELTIPHASGTHVYLLCDPLSLPVGVDTWRLGRLEPVYGGA